MGKRLGIAALVVVARLAYAGQARADDPPPAPPAPAAEPPVEDIDVTGTRVHERGGSTHVVKDAQLRRFSYDDAHQVLLGVPGVYVRPEDGVGLRPNIGIRGANSDRSKKITLMEDGVLVGPAPYSAPAAYYFPLIDRMRSVRVIKGPSAILYGPHTVGGAVDLLTREIPSRTSGMLDLAGGQYGFNKQHVLFGTSDERAGVVIEGMRLANGGFKTIDGAPDANTGFVRNEWMAKASYTPDPTARISNELQVKATYSDEVSNETYLGLTDADFRASPYRRYRSTRFDRMENHRTSLVVTHKARLLPELDVQTDVYRHDFTRSWRKVNSFGGSPIFDVLMSPETPRNRIYYGVLTGAVDATTPDQTIYIGPNQRVFVSQGLQTRVRASGKTGPVRHAVEYGVRAHYDEIVRKHTQDGFVMTDGSLVGDGRATQTTADNKGASWALAMHLTDAMTWGPVTVTPGMRIEAIHTLYREALTKGFVPAGTDGTTYQVLVPGVSGYWALRKDLGILAGVHRGFSPVPPESARIAQPETSVNYEAGVRYARKRARAEIVGFFNDYSNLTNICTFSNGCQAENLDRQFDAGRAQIWGGEAFAEVEPKVAKDMSLPMRVSYTYTWTELLSGFVSGDPQFGSVRDGDELPYVPPHQLAATAGVETKRWGVAVSGTFVDRMREIAGQGDQGLFTDSYFLLDASAKVRPTRWMELYLNARNITDDQYLASRRPFGARPGAPRWVQAGVRLSF
ncbi:MAG: TonB-dependent receptor [Myxococcales bacterium]|nr:TonB-dependent receptor [Myxococcales bacterium]